MSELVCVVTQAHDFRSMADHPSVPRCKVQASGTHPSCQRQYSSCSPDRNPWLNLCIPPPGNQSTSVNDDSSGSITRRRMSRRVTFTVHFPAWSPGSATNFTTGADR